MFQFFSDASASKSSDAALPFLSRGKANAILADTRVNSRIDLLSESLGARLPERGYFKH